MWGLEVETSQELGVGAPLELEVGASPELGVGAPPELVIVVQIGLGVPLELVIVVQLGLGVVDYFFRFQQPTDRVSPKRASVSDRFSS